MNDMLIMDLVSLTRYEAALEEFKANIQKYCNELEADINTYGKYMQDAKSQDAIKNTRATCMEVKRCIGHVDNALAFVRELKSKVSNL
jgi:hypothetical protein